MTEQGFFNWNDYIVNLLEHVIVHNFETRTTGFIRDVVFEVLKFDYDYLRTHKSHPYYPDPPHMIFENAISCNRLHELLLRLFNSNYEND